MRNKDSRQGVAAVECAFIAPLFLLLLWGTIDVGQYVNVGQIVTSASREGARQAVRPTTVNVSEVQTAVQNYLAGHYPDVPAATLNSAITVNVTDSAGVPIPSGDLSSVASGTQVNVEVQLQYSAVRWLTGLGFMNNRTMPATTYMRRE